MNVCDPSNLTDALSAALATPYEVNSVFAVMPGCVTDKNSKTLSFADGTSVSVTGRIKTSGVGSVSSRSIRITSKTTGGVLRFFVAAAGTSGQRTWTIAKEDGTILETSTTILTTAPSEFSYTIPEEGVYFIYSTVNGINFHYLDYTQEVELGTETGFQVTATNAKTSYLLGEEFSSDGLSVEALYSSGVKTTLNPADYTVDSSLYQKDTAGTYRITVSYKTYTSQTYDVSVHAVNSIVLYTTPIQSASGNVNVTRTPTVYKVGGSFTSAGLLVKAVTDENKEVLLDSSVYTLSTPDLSTAGAKKVTATYKTLTSVFTITVIDSSLLVKNAAGIYDVKVVKDVTDGTMENGFMEFRTIQNAVDFLKVVATSSDYCHISIASGTYIEKLYIDVPNLTINSVSGAKADVIIESLEDSDSVDAKGTAWSTYGSSSTTILAAASGFVASNVTFKNAKFTTMDEYKAASGNLQACALVNNATNVAFSQCGFVGFQDTLYLHAGNAYFNGCEISGMTDYIFGESSNALFSNCTIISMNRGDVKNGGYITACKPTLATGDVGFVFQGCTVQGETGVTDGTVSLGRPWGAAAKVAYLNCTMSSAISVSAYPCSTNNARWEGMSGNVPTKADFEEYGNTGAGSISAAVAGGTLLSQDAYTAFDAKVKAAFAWALS